MLQVFCCVTNSPYFSRCPFLNKAKAAPEEGDSVKVEKAKKAEIVKEATKADVIRLDQEKDATNGIEETNRWYLKCNNATVHLQFPPSQATTLDMNRSSRTRS